jgi:hypothetical protein
MPAITVHKLSAHGREVWRYPAQIVAQAPYVITVEAPFSRDNFDLGYVVFKRNDRFVEHFYNDRWYNVFAVYDRDDKQLKGWYCNLCRPATWSLEKGIHCEDLALDVWVGADGTRLVLDEHELDELGLPHAEYTAVRRALYQLLNLAEIQQLPR